MKKLNLDQIDNVSGGYAGVIARSTVVAVVSFAIIVEEFTSEFAKGFEDGFNETRNK